ncbi:MAG: hypothetical protein ACE5NG_03135 [bacterium]
MSKYEGLLINSTATFPGQAVQEVTFECAPRKVTEAKLWTLREAGITRISLGVQQLNESIIHDFEEFHFQQVLILAQGINP